MYPGDEWGSGVLQTTCLLSPNPPSFGTLSNYKSVKLHPFLLPSSSLFPSSITPPSPSLLSRISWVYFGGKKYSSNQTLLIFNIHAISSITPVSIYGFTGFQQERFAILLKERRISYIEKISLKIIGE